MIVIALLIYIGIIINANVWYFCLTGCLAFFQFMDFCIKLYNKGKKDSKK